MDFDTRGAPADPAAAPARAAQGGAGEPAASAAQGRQLQLAHRVVAQAQASFARLYELAPVGFCTVDLRGEILHANRALARLLGRPPDTLAGTLLSRHVLAADWYVFEGLRRHALAFQADAEDGAARADDDADAAQGVELRMFGPAGAVLRVCWTATSDWAPAAGAGDDPLPGPARPTQAVLHLAITDLSMHKRAEAALRSSQHFASAVADNVAGMLSYWDRELRCRFSNRHHQAWFDRSALQMQGLRIQVLLGQAQYEHDEGFIRRALQGEQQAFERALTKADGQVRHFWVQYTPHVVDGAVLGFFALGTDVTAHRAGQDAAGRQGAAAAPDPVEELVALRTADLAAARHRADAANQAKSAFLATLSHEIRTPLTAILGLSHLLRREVGSPEQARRLGQIERAGDHLLALVNDVLDLSKIESDHLQLEDVVFELPSVFEAVRSMVAEAAQHKGLAIELDCAQPPGRLRGDPTRLRQGLLNLASNAVKFTEQGQVVLRAELLQAHGSCLQLRFSVQDTGPGLSAQQLARLFQPFAQGDPSIARQYGGTGLGLAITRRLAQLMGGETGVDRLQGGGCRFWFTAWLQRPAAEADEAAASASAGDALASEDEAQLRRQHARARILLAEDNAVNREVTLAMLAHAGLSADTAVDGLEAVQRARDGPYDLVLMDMQMPGLDGLQATRAIRAMPGWRDRPIVALTANVLPEHRQACMDAGMNGFIVKPFKVAAFYAALSQALGDRGPAQADGGG